MADKVADKKQSLEAALQAIEKQFGKGAIMRMEGDNIQKVEAVSTGCLSLDFALGIGGLPKGRIIEIYGPESSGKTTVALHVVAEVQRTGGTAAFIDAEHALDPMYAEKLGVVLENLYISQPDSGEQALDIVETLVRSNAVDIIVIDSVAALTPQAEIDGDMGDSHVGLIARLMSQALRKLTAIASKSKCTIIFINQLRDKIGVTYGSPETTTGGKALKFYSSVRIDIRKSDSVKDGADITGNRIKAKIVKNKIAPPFKVAEFDIMYGTGISQIGCVLDLAAANNIILKSGSWYSYKDEKIGQGRDKSIEFLTNHKELAQDIEKQVRAKYDL
ncbi:MAG: recombinase RecA [Clostridia bacterium]